MTNLLSSPIFASIWKPLLLKTNKMTMQHPEDSLLQFCKMPRTVSSQQLHAVFGPSPSADILLYNFSGRPHTDKFGDPWQVLGWRGQGMCSLLCIIKWLPNFSAMSLPVAVYDPAACLGEGSCFPAPEMAHISTFHFQRCILTTALS